MAYIWEDDHELQEKARLAMTSKENRDRLSLIETVVLTAWVKDGSKGLSDVYSIFEPFERQDVDTRLIAAKGLAKLQLGSVEKFMSQIL